jgi:hypothetical protein
MRLTPGVQFSANEAIAGETGSAEIVERRKRDYDHGDYHVKCKSSNTGKF